MAMVKLIINGRKNQFLFSDNIYKSLGASTELYIDLCTVQELSLSSRELCEEVIRICDSSKIKYRIVSR